jgi:sugar lactone lactonase YvrE
MEQRIHNLAVPAINEEVGPSMTVQSDKVAWLSIVMFGLAFGCAGDPLSPILTCASTDAMNVDCQFQNPEDLVPSPDGRILVSQFGAMDGSLTGNIAVYAPDSRSLEVVFPTDSEMQGSWGDAQCSPPDTAKFAPHGIDIERRIDGRYQLAVVNHGGGESVELFEVGLDGSLTWRGCAKGPEGAYFNDVVVLEDGGFWVTHMFEHGHDFRSFLSAGMGFDTGWVYAWSPDGGFVKLPGTDAPFPNGLEKSQDERFVYINTYSSGGVRKVDVTSGELVASTSLASVDNSSWASDGRLLVATHTGSIRQMMGCGEITEGACGMPFEILSLDPDDLSSRVAIRHEGAPMGGATVALELDGIIYLGSFAGDRIGRVSVSEAEEQ